MLSVVGAFILKYSEGSPQAQRRRIVELEHELDMAMRAVERAEARAKAEAKRRQEAEQHVQSIESELENNAGRNLPTAASQLLVMTFPV